MQELNHHPKGEIETESSYLNATSESCQLANPPVATPSRSVHKVLCAVTNSLFDPLTLAFVCYVCYVHRLTTPCTTCKQGRSPRLSFVAVDVTFHCVLMCTGGAPSD